MPADPERNPNLARDALDNLVHQFARPMDFLRELVQNSIDAGSPRVDVWLRHQAEQGVLEVHVDDFGEGMDEAIVDRQLTRMFSSTKEGDLTKIGKFGIGFTSVFAIGPEAVLVHTGRHGEAWELLFHADRSFDKTRLNHPVSGTSITVFERLPAEQVPAFIQQCRWVLRYWCRHSDTPITFEDRTGRSEDQAQQSADPFAGFGATEPVSELTPGPETINEPMGLDSPLQLEHHHQGVRVVVGYTDTPSYAWFNGGLTLIETGNAEALGVYAERLSHVSFEVKDDALEHTLTRDNVLHDEAWTMAMEVVQAAAAKLRARLLDRLVAAVEAGEEIEAWLRLLARECRQVQMHQTNLGFAQRCKLYDVRGQVVDLETIQAAERDLGLVLLDGGDEALRAAVLSEGYPVLPDRPAVRALLMAAFSPSAFPFGRRQRQLARLHEVFCLAEPSEASSWSDRERGLLDRTRELLQEVVGRRVSVVLGRFHASVERAPLALEGPMEGGLFQLQHPSLLRLPLFLRSRCVLLDRTHPTFHALLLASQVDMTVASLSLAHLLLDAADVRRQGPWEEAVDLAVRRSAEESA